MSNNPKQLLSAYHCTPPNLGCCNTLCLMSLNRNSELQMLYTFFFYAGVISSLNTKFSPPRHSLSPKQLKIREIKEKHALKRKLVTLVLTTTTITL